MIKKDKDGLYIPPKEDKNIGTIMLLLVAFISGCGIGGNFAALLMGLSFLSYRFAVVNSFVFLVAVLLLARNRLFS